MTREKGNNIVFVNLKAKQVPYILDGCKKENVVRGFFPLVSCLIWAARDEEPGFETIF